ncbi:MAG: hypothetical protein PUF08_04560 [Clostridiales bacterium]|nr:hypothetical protein [Clostridiales bacterium]
MLKSTFKKVSAIAIAGTMLAGMMAVPANAMSSVTKTEKVTTQVINENFNGYVVDETLPRNLTGSVTNFEQNANIKFKHYNGTNWPGDRNVGIQQVEEGNNAFAISGWVGMWLNFDSPNGAPTTVNEGDIVTVSFKYKYESDADKKYQNIRVKLNDNANTAYYGREGAGNSTASGGGLWWHAGDKDYVANRGGLVRLVGNNGWSISGKNNYAQFTTAADTWYTMKITINTADENYDGEQTIKVESDCIYNGETVPAYQYGLFDADYNGSDDKVNDKIRSIESLQFDTFGTGSANDTLFTIDDLNVSVTGDRVVDYEYVSDLSNVVLDENFDNFSGSVTTNGTLTGTKFIMSTPGWATGGTDFTVTSVDGAAKTSATKTASTALLADFDDVALGAGEAIRFSFDITNKAGVLANVGSTSMASPKICLTTLDGKRTSDLTGDTTSVQMHHIYDGRTIRPGRLQTVTEAMMLDGYTYHFEYTIVPSNPAHGNKQTLTVKVTSPDNALTHSWQTTDRFSQYKETFYMDADRDTDGEQKFDSLSRFYFTNYYTTPDGTIDNVKVEVIKPGFEVKDVDNQGNTYTFSGTTPIDLNYLVDASAASKVVIAQYAEGGRMINAETKDLAATGAGTVTVTPDANANMIKLMVLDMSTAVPYAKVFKLTKSGN